MRKNPPESENGGDKNGDKRLISFKEYLEKLYQNYPIPHEGMFIVDYVKLHRLMLDDVREYNPRMQQILDKFSDPTYYIMWLEKTLETAEKLAQQSQDYMLTYIFLEDGIKVGWAKTQEIYKRR